MAIGRISFGSTGGGGAPTGAAGGGLSGSYPNPSVVVVAAGSAGPLSATDASTTNSRTPSGSAGGDVGGTYPSSLTVTKLNGQSLAALATGIIKNTTTTGVPVIAVAADIPTAAVGSTGPLSANTAAAVAPLVSTVVAAVGTGTTWARVDHSHPRDWWTAADFGYLACTFLPELTSSSTTAMTPGTVYVFKLHLSSVQTIANVHLAVQTIGNTLTTGQCAVGLYSPAGTLLGSSTTINGGTDIAAAFMASTGMKQITLTAVGGLTALPAGDYRVALLQNGSVPALIKSAGSATAVNGNLAATASKYGSADISVTALAGTLGTVSAYSGAVFAGIY